MLSAAFISIGCDVLDPAVKGSGKVDVEKRQVAPFTGIAVDGSADVTVTYGTEQRVEITTDDNILPIITTEVSDRVLNIDSKESYSTSYGVSVAITIPTLVSIEIDGSGDVGVEGTQLENRPVENFKVEIDGSGDVRISGLSATNVSAEIEGSGDITIAGTGVKLKAKVEGSGNIGADMFQVLNGTVWVEGSGDVRVYATESLEATVSGSGDIYYRGNPPRLNTSVTGSGDIIKLP